MIPLFVSNPVLPGADKNPLADAGLQRTGNIAFGIVADHRNILWLASQAPNPGHEEIGRGLAKKHRRCPARKLESLHERAGIETELSIGILEDTIGGQREERRALQQFAKRRVHTVVGEVLTGVSNNDRSPLLIGSPAKSSSRSG